MKSCSKCQLEYDDDCMFCKKCGDKLEGGNDKSYCQYCGKCIDEDSDFCPFCGKSIYYEKKDDKLNNVAISVNNVKKNNNTNVSPVKLNENVQIKKEEKDESTVVSCIKFIVYLVGVFVLWFIFKILIKGGISILRHEGFGLPFIIIFLLGGCVLYFLFYRNDI